MGIDLVRLARIREKIHSADKEADNELNGLTPRYIARLSTSPASPTFVAVSETNASLRWFHKS
jgi:hypothetical protein